MIRWLLAFVFMVSTATAAPSAKRGICAKDLSPEDWKALSPGVSWWYNWHFEPDGSVPEGGPEFIPMLWGNHPDSWKGLERSLKARPKPRALLVINEPNLRTQANLDPKATAKAWRKAKEVGDRFGIPVVGPQMSIGCPTNDCVSADDPIQKKRVTYTWMVPFIEAFQRFLPKGSMPVLAIHPYGNVGELKWAVAEARKRSGGPVWVTEFNEWKAKDEDAAIEYLRDAVAFMESSPDVAGYAWFMARMKDDPKNSLLAPERGTLTRLGEVYVNLPSGLVDH